MRKTLLASVAALALAAGGNLAFSQGGGGSGAGGGAGGSGGGTGGGTMQQSPGGGGGGMSGGASGGGTMQQSPATGGAVKEGAPAGSAQTEPQMAPGGQKGQPSKQQQGQAPRDRDGSKQGASERNDTGTKQGASERDGGTKQGASERDGGTKQGASDTKQGGGTTAAGTKGGASSSVSLTTEQRTTIRQTVLTSSAPRVTNVNFNVRVGTVVPRSVRIVPLPATLIEIQPTWRGYMYFVYQDEIIVVEPGTLRIVAVLDV
jgi:hypothetical protein